VAGATARRSRVRANELRYPAPAKRAPSVDN
jgi:hypothetical protein